MVDKAESFEMLTERFARAAFWLENSGWPTRQADVELADRIYLDWLRLTDRLWISSGERDRYPLITALDEAFRQRHDPILAEHLCVVFSAAFEMRARETGANRQAGDQ